MSAINVTSVRVLNNPAAFDSPIQVEISYECLYALKHGEKKKNERNGARAGGERACAGCRSVCVCDWRGPPNPRPHGLRRLPSLVSGWSRPGVWRGRRCRDRERGAAPPPNTLDDAPPGPPSIASLRLSSFSDLEWKLIYVGSAESEKYDQVLDSVLVGPVYPGQYRFVFQVSGRAEAAEGRASAVSCGCFFFKGARGPEECVRGARRPPPARAPRTPTHAGPAPGSAHSLRRVAPGRRAARSSPPSHPHFSLPSFFFSLSQADPPDAAKLPPGDVVGVTALLLTCSYQAKEFLRVGYYVNVEYLDEALREAPPERPVVEK